MVPERTFKRQNSVVKTWQLLIGGPMTAGAHSHGTTGTMVNSALAIDLKAFYNVQLFVISFMSDNKIHNKRDSE